MSYNYPVTCKDCNRNLSMQAFDKKPPPEKRPSPEACRTPDDPRCKKRLARDNKALKVPENQAVKAGSLETKSDVPLEKMTKKQLKAIAKEMGLKKYGKLNTKDLVMLIENAGNPSDEPFPDHGLATTESTDSEGNAEDVEAYG